MRINKYIAECGVTSRRNADILIKEGKVKLNGKTVLSPGVDVNEENDSVSVDGKKIEFEVKVGDIVLTSKYGGTEVKYDGKEYKILSASDILAVIG